MKTTFGSQCPRALICSFEIGTHALANVKAVPCQKWTTFKKVLSQLRKPEAKEMYDTVVIDTAVQAWTECERYILAREGVESIKDIPWG